MIQNEADLVAKLLRIEALHAGATTPGERVAAENAMKRLQGRLRDARAFDPPVEYRFTMQDKWSRSLFVALLRRYELVPYRYRRQRHTTVMVSVPKRFVDLTLWPEFVALDRELRTFLAGVTDRVIREALHADTSEADEREEPAALPPPP
jgi:hypothetical protein